MRPAVARVAARIITNPALRDARKNCCTPEQTVSFSFLFLLRGEQRLATGPIQDGQNDVFCVSVENRELFAYPMKRRSIATARTFRSATTELASLRAQVTFAKPPIPESFFLAPVCVSSATAKQPREERVGARIGSTRSWSGRGVPPGERAPNKSRNTCCNGSVRSHLLLKVSAGAPERMKLKLGRFSQRERHDPNF
jgi:hypothetical protein